MAKEKKRLFCHTPGGAKSSAIVYSLIQTAIENKLKPQAYLQSRSNCMAVSKLKQSCHDQKAFRLNVNCKTTQNSSCISPDMMVGYGCLQCPGICVIFSGIISCFFVFW